MSPATQRTASTSCSALGSKPSARTEARALAAARLRESFDRTGRLPFDAEWSFARDAGLTAIVRFAVVVRFLVVAVGSGYQCSGRTKRVWLSPERNRREPGPSRREAAPSGRLRQPVGYLTCRFFAWRSVLGRFRFAFLCLHPSTPTLTDVCSTAPFWATNAAGIASFCLHRFLSVPKAE